MTVRSLSAAQLVDIYSGRITNWRELGGKAAPIRAVGRENSDAIRQARWWFDDYGMEWKG